MSFVELGLCDPLHAPYQARALAIIRLEADVGGDMSFFRD